MNRTSSLQSGEDHEQDLFTGHFSESCHHGRFQIYQNSIGVPVATPPKVLQRGERFLINSYYKTVGSLKNSPENL